MARDPKKRQKKLAKQKAKRKEKRQEMARAASRSVAEELREVNDFPVVDCFVTKDLESQGIGHVLLSRRCRNGEIAVADFLVDRYCLGVKDAFVAFERPGPYRREIVDKISQQFGIEEISPAHARKLVEESVSYAMSFGLPPHDDYHKAKHIFGSIDVSECEEEFEFGKDGKPFYINGPNDSPAFQKRVLKAIRAGEEGGGDYLLMSGPVD